MTARQAFSISIAAHLMVFGSALAIAQYDRELFLSSGDTIVVVLISSGQASGGQKSDNGKGSLPRHELPAALPLNQADTVKNEMPADIYKGPDTASFQPSGQMTKNAEIDSDDAGQAPSTSGVGQGTSAQFGLVAPPEWAILAEAIERTKNYPRLARERGIEGVVRVRFRLTSSGTVEKIEIVQSSGSEILDKASIGAVYRAAPMPYVSGWVEMPMKYVLK
jgi:TonB family protein